ncbi:MAG: SiaB family protein kinase [Bacteroidota bacterium]
MTESESTILQSQIDERFRSEMELHSDDSDATILLSHFGAFSRDLINGITDTVENLLISTCASKKNVKRIFSILIEGLQNILAHGELDEDGKQLSYLILLNTKDRYQIIMGNLILSSEIDDFEKYLQRINSLDKDELKTLYMEVLNNNLFSDKGGAGLGFLIMKMKSDSNLWFQFKPLNEQFHFFSVKVIVDKNQ